eukprot:scaffold149807_cov30-Tisochrysis_lutea.AAC.1
MFEYSAIGMERRVRRRARGDMQRERARSWRLVSDAQVLRRLARQCSCAGLHSSAHAHPARARERGGLNGLLRRVKHGCTLAKQSPPSRCVPACGEESEERASRTASAGETDNPLCRRY